MPASCPSRSSALPGIAAACATNGLTSWDDSASSSTLTNASTRMVPWMNRVGPSTPTAPMATTWPGVPDENDELAPTAMVSPKAPARPPRASPRCRDRRAARGTNASTSTPATATAKTSNMGESCQYSMCGGAMAGGAAARLARRVTELFPSGGG